MCCEAVWFMMIHDYVRLFDSAVFVIYSVSKLHLSGNGILTFCVTGVALQPYQAGSHAFSNIPFENLLTEQVLNCRGTKGKGHVVLRCPRDAKESGLLRLCLVAVRMSFTRACCYQTSKHPERSSKLDCLTDKTANYNFTNAIVICVLTKQLTDTCPNNWHRLRTLLTVNDGMGGLAWLASWDL